MFLKSKKIISMLLVFVIVFTYMGQTLEAVATTDGLSAITNGFFKTEEMRLNGYFFQENEQSNEKISDVNEKATLVLELSPNNIGQGFLKKGTISAKALDGSDANFKFSKIKNVSIDELEEEVKYEGDETPEENVINENQNLENQVIENNIISNDQVIEDENVIESNPVENDTVDDTTIENEISNETIINQTIENNVTNDIVENISFQNQTVANNTISNETIIEEDQQNVTNSVEKEMTSRSNEPRTTEENQEELINEEQVIENLEQTEETYEELTAKDFEIEILDDHQISVQNVIYNTKIEVEIEYNAKEEVEIADLYKEVNLALSGTYINVNLEKIETEAQSAIKVGWSYHQEMEVAGEYTQFSPFKLGDHTGSIAQNKITVKRETEDANYLPIKQTTIEIDVPEWNGNRPQTVNVQATKLMASKGEDVGEVTFGTDDWKYDAENQKIFIIVNNEKEGKAVNSIGEDEYIIVYRYDAYTEDEFVTMPNYFKATVEEYSANNNQVTTKEFSNSQNVKTKVNDLITYNIGATEEKLNKAKINANYHSAEALYETEFTTTVNVNILTSDLLEEFKINSSKEVYVSDNSVEIDATPDVYYNKVKFNYSEIKNLLQNGTTIEIQSVTGQLLYTLNNELITSQDACEVRLESKEKGIYVVFKNIANNGNIGIEFTKAIGKSNYEKSAFNHFDEIKSYVSAELKYQNYEERYGMTEIATTKKLQDSETFAELILSNKNLNTATKNDGVEARIVLNNDKQNTDVYQNPTFELVFPKYVTDVSIENIGLIYGCGLKIAHFETYKENDFVKMRIETTGIQTTFSESVITNGTNIILNLNLTLDEYTPKKQDQIKMYYCNEAVTNYKAQTKWSINHSIPNGILKQTNGFDVATVNYQAPNGFITSNAIINYDGQGSKIKSIRQGEKKAEIKEKADAQVATMELVAMNNTGNKCSNATFLGRIPFKGNKSVMTEKELGSTATVKFLSAIKENVQNPNLATIYYSTNEKATKDLKDSKNAWTTTVQDWSRVKSYMICVKGELKEGVVLKYTYDFEIPANLDYNEKLYGSFGGNYNNHYEKVVAYESTEADLVGVGTASKENFGIFNSTKTENTNIEVTQEISANEFHYQDQFEYRITVENKSDVENDIFINGNLPLNLFLEKTTMTIDGKEEKIETYNQFLEYEKLTAKGKIEIVATGKVMDWGNLNEELDLSSIVTVEANGQNINSNEIRVKVYKDEKKLEEPEEDFEEELEEYLEEEVKEETYDETSGIYSISGNVYVDANTDGLKTEEDKKIKSQVQVQLRKGSNMIKATTTDSEGDYAFSNLEPGDYSVVYNYDKESYKATQYTEQETETVSKTLETEEGVSVTDNISITDASIENVNAGLQEKDKFDFSIKQHLSSAIVSIDGKETEYNYENSNLAKLEIAPSDLKKATVKLNYKIIVENTGNTTGKVTSIVNYLPNGVIFNPAENREWSTGLMKQNIYYDGLKETEIAPGESREISLTLSKKMTEENTGVISNKVQIAYTESTSRLTEEVEGNFATQETIITVTQGASTGVKIIITTVIFGGMIGLFGYMIKTGKLEKKFNGRKLIKKIYK